MCLALLSLYFACIPMLIMIKKISNHYDGSGHLWRIQTLTFDGFGPGQILVVTDYTTHLSQAVRVSINLGVVAAHERWYACDRSEGWQPVISDPFSHVSTLAPVTHDSSLTGWSSKVVVDEVICDGICPFFMTRKWLLCLFTLLLGLSFFCFCENKINKCQRWFVGVVTVSLFSTKQ